MASAATTDMRSSDTTAYTSATTAAATGNAVQARTGLGSVDLALCVLYLLSVLCVGFYFTLKERRDRAQFRQARLRRALEVDRDSSNKHRHQSTRSNKQNSSTKTMTATATAPAHTTTNHGVDDKALEEYYLGGRRIPWWALGIADVSSYIDISGTMINTALVYALGVKGMYIEIRGGLCLFLAFQLAYTGKLSRRCPVKTRGEWIKFRFGDRRDGVLLRTTIAFTSMMNGILAVTYFAVGGGKFFTEFVHVPPWLGLPSEFWAALGLMLVAMLYTVASGFTTVVYTDVYQSLFIFASFAVVAVMGVATSLPEQFAVFVPVAQSPSQSYGRSHVSQTSDPAGIHNDPSLLKILYTKSVWVSALPPAHLELPPETTYAMYNSFSVVLGTYVLLQTMRSSSGPGGSGLQSVLATKSEKDVRSQTFLAMLLLSLRWAFSAGVAVLAIRYSADHAAVRLDPERVVPVVIDQMLPVGVKGFVLAALLAAALTTFDTTIHSASAYWTIDIYHALVNPQASAQQLVWHARGATLVVLLAGALLSLHVDTINRIWGFMTIALAGGFVWPFVFSWYWARFNAYSCLSGVLAGFVAAFATFIFAPLLPELTAFAITSSVSCVVSVVCCLCTRPVSDHVLRRFYRFARPPGAWSAVKRVCFSDDTIGAIDKENRRDLACTGLIALVQLAVYLLAVSVVARAWTQSLVLLVVVAGLSPLIYTKWYAQLQDRPVGLKSDLTAGLLEEE